MIKRILVIISVSMLAFACNKPTASSGKPITKNTPSVNKAVKEGSLSLNASKTALFSESMGQGSIAASGDITTITPAEDTSNNESKAEGQREYSVLTRLYSTVWFQTEEEYDDGQLETESTFLFFNENSEVEERELETGEPAESDYSTVEIVDGIELVTSQNNNDATRDRNACIVKNMEIGDNDTEYQLYYLKDENTLYVIELTEKYTSKSKLKEKADTIIKELEENNASRYDEDKYALSTVSI